MTTATAPAPSAPRKHQEITAIIRDSRSHHHNALEVDQANAVREIDLMNHRFSFGVLRNANADYKAELLAMVRAEHKAASARLEAWADETERQISEACEASKGPHDCQNCGDTESPTTLGRPHYATRCTPRLQVCEHCKAHNSRFVPYFAG